MFFVDENESVRDRNFSDFKSRHIPGQSEESTSTKQERTQGF